MRTPPVIEEGLAIIIAAVLAIAGIVYTARQQRRMLRKQHTYQVLDKLNDWKEYEDNLDFAASLIKEGKVPNTCKAADKKACDKLDFLLNLYEFLASAIISGDIDEGLVKYVERDRLSRIYLKFIGYVHQNRAERDNDRIWENLEFMCHRWSATSADPFPGLIDRFRLKPSMNTFFSQRAEIRGALLELSRRIK